MVSEGLGEGDNVNGGVFRSEGLCPSAGGGTVSVGAEG